MRQPGSGDDSGCEVQLDATGETFLFSASNLLELIFTFSEKAMVGSVLRSTVQPRGNSLSLSIGPAHHGPSVEINKLI